MWESLGVCGEAFLGYGKRALLVTYSLWKRLKALCCASFPYAVAIGLHISLCRIRLVVLAKGNIVVSYHFDFAYLLSAMKLWLV